LKFCMGFLYGGFDAIGINMSFPTEVPSRTRAYKSVLEQLKSRPQWFEGAREWRNFFPRRDFVETKVVGGNRITVCDWKVRELWEDSRYTVEWINKWKAGETVFERRSEAHDMWKVRWEFLSEFRHWVISGIDEDETYPTGIRRYFGWMPFGNPNNYRLGGWWIEEIRDLANWWRRTPLKYDEWAKTENQKFKEYNESADKTYPRRNRNPFNGKWKKKYIAEKFSWKRECERHLEGIDTDTDEEEEEEDEVDMPKCMTCDDFADWKTLNGKFDGVKSESWGKLDYGNNHKFFWNLCGKCFKEEQDEDTDEETWEDRVGFPKGIYDSFEDMIVGEYGDESSQAKEHNCGVYAPKI
jgi:hypothetical protein